MSLSIKCPIQIIQTSCQHFSAKCFKEPGSNKSDLSFSHPLFLSLMPIQIQTVCLLCVQIEVKMSFSESLSNPSIFTTHRVWCEVQDIHLFVSLSKPQPANYWLTFSVKKRKEIKPGATPSQSWQAVAKLRWNTPKVKCMQNHDSQVFQSQARMSDCRCAAMDCQRRHCLDFSH